MSDQHEKRFQQQKLDTSTATAEELKERLLKFKRVAMGEEAADVVIKNANVFSVFTGEIHEPSEDKPTDIAIVDGYIVGTGGDYTGKEIIDGTGLTAVPGFIDCHVHPESSHITPQEFDRIVTPRGTTTVIADPHEISNVLGHEGIQYFVDSAQHMVMDMIVQMSSCVPATNLGTSGAQLKVDDLIQYIDDPHVGGLAEMMNLGGFFGEDDDVFDKLAAFGQAGKRVDGHMPGVADTYMLNALRSCGICNDHESTTFEEAKAKLEKDISVFIRQGTVAQDAKRLSGLVKPFTAAHIGMCTDDRSPMDIEQDGHIDHIIRMLIAEGADPASVYKVATWSAAQGFGLQDRGSISPGKKADIVLLSDFNNCTVEKVVKGGKLVTDELFEAREDVAPVGLNSVKLARDLEADDFALTANDIPSDYTATADGIQTTIPEVFAGLLVTGNAEVTIPVNDQGEMQVDQDNDILKLAVVERHGKSGNIGRFFVKGFGIKDGAIAVSVGHDDHNITIVGTNDEDMALAVNEIKRMGGGYAAVKNGKVLDGVELPIAGLISQKPAEEFAADMTKHADIVQAELSPRDPDPYMYLYFLSLSVIPDVKVSDVGITKFDPANGDKGPRFLKQQGKAPKLN